MEEESDKTDEKSTNIRNEKSLEEINESPAVRQEAEKPKKEVPIVFSSSEWFSAKRWSNNPFTFSILPSLFVGYKEQTSRLMLFLEEKHKFLLVVGPTGSGKTTLLKWIQGNLPGSDTLYIGKPPETPADFVDIFNDKFKAPWFLRPFSPKIKNIYQVPDFLNKRLKKKHLVVFIDEIHEADLEILEWLRVLGDQVDNISFLLSGLPSFDHDLSTKLETFRKRITAKIELLSLTKEETQQLIQRRIQHVGGQGNEFPQDVVDFIYSRSGGFPREVLRLCDEFINQAILKGSPDISLDLLGGVTEEKIEQQVYLDVLEKMTPMQREILEVLAQKPLSPGQIANSLNLEKYKSRQHAVRSVNNILKFLLKQDYVERQQFEKTFVYSLTPKIKTLMVKA
ncbi:MAG: AAA family ATPase [Candidatus Aenigmarchaeota archaeon]|nr:AAA family ATPase [Candidatus Aenigmarchaeota archaeon]